MSSNMYARNLSDARSGRLALRSWSRRLFLPPFHSIASAGTVLLTLRYRSYMMCTLHVHSHTRGQAVCMCMCVLSCACLWLCHFVNVCTALPRHSPCQRSCASLRESEPRERVETGCALALRGLAVLARVESSSRLVRSLRNCSKGSPQARCGLCRRRHRLGAVSTHYHSRRLCLVGRSAPSHPAHYPERERCPCRPTIRAPPPWARPGVRSNVFLIYARPVVSSVVVPGEPCPAGRRRQ